MYRRLHCSQKPRLALIFFSVRVLPLPLLGMRVLRTREFYIEIKETYVPYEKFMITLEFEQDDELRYKFHSIISNASLGCPGESTRENFILEN